MADQKKPTNPKPVAKPKTGEKSMDLFKHSNKPIASSIPPKMAQDINETLRRLRILEERYSNIRKKTQLAEQNMLEDTNNVTEDIKLLNINLKELRKEINEISGKMKILNQEISSSAQKRDLDLLNKYMNFWDPMNFISREEAAKIIEDILNEIKMGRKKI
ncbi:hypothetical protein HOD20_08215 [archaeon]|jgi:hypothetical protein|nr:hypothetical protein [archaeon]MBT4647193.1 hypothetical protein [archaeon]MBT6822196.1 hypothetical protein [archaeon]MBT7391729.1 hypothetical protein [archaeon]